MNTKLLLNAALLSGAACALAPSVQLTQRTSRSGLPMRTVANNNGRAQHVSLLQSRKLRRRSNNKSLLFYTNDPSPLQDGEGSDILASSSSQSPSTLSAIDFDRVQHNEVLNMMTQHAEEQFDSNEFFGEEHVSLSSADFIEASGEGVASIESSSTAPNKTRPAPSSVEETASVSETRQIINEVTAIALPSLGGMLLDPIMSLIDTACVGQISTTALAAMAPCTSIFQFIG